MATQILQKIDIGTSGGTFNIDVSNPADFYWLFPTGGGTVVLAADVIIGNINFPPIGTVFQIGIRGGDFDLNGNTFTIQGQLISQAQLDAGFVYIENASDTSFLPPGFFFQTYLPNFFDANVISGNTIISGTADLNKLAIGNAAYIVQANAAGVATYTQVTGDITITDAGVTSITAGAIVNADINAAAAIERTKLAIGTASQVVVNDVSGVMTSLAQLTPALGGTGTNTSASTGFPILAAGVWSVGAITETLRLDVSFETGCQGTYYMTVPFPCTVTAAKARVTKPLSGTDAGTVQLQNNSGTDFTGGLITIPMSSVHGTGITATSITANNVFTAGQEIRFLVDKPTDGGACSIDVTITRLTLS